MKNKKILLTGGSGFIGSHLIESLICNGYSVTNVDLWECNELKHLDRMQYHFVKLDVNNLYKEKKILEAHDYLIHFASILGTSETIEKYPIDEVISTNLLSSTRLMDSFCKNDKKMIIPTTPEVNWLNPYKITKRAVESFAQLYAQRWNKNIVCVRLGNIYGPRERFDTSDKTLNFKEAPYHYKKIIPSFIMDTLQSQPITVYGSGEQRSEYIYIEDVTNVLIKLLQCNQDLRGKTIDLGSNRNYSVIEIIETIEKVWGRKLEKQMVEMRSGEMTMSSINLDSTALKKILNYETQFSLTEGIRKTIPYYENIWQQNRNDDI